jgi:hypothetical protein
MPGGSDPAWAQGRPSALQIATCWFPDSTSASRPGAKLRPCLITRVLRNRATDQTACDVHFGTTNLKVTTRLGLDLIIQDPVELDLVGLPRATRFDLDQKATLPWNDAFFGCWAGYSSPIIGSLTVELVKEYAFLMMRRLSAR